MMETPQARMPRWLTVPASGDRRSRGTAAIAALAILLVIAALTSIAVGPVRLGIGAILETLSRGGPAEGSQSDTIIWAIRLPRTLLGIFVGAALAVSGAVMQGLFRNPLADPSLTGISSGAALAGVTTIVLGGAWLSPLPAMLASYVLPLAAFLGSLAATLCLYGIATLNGRTSIATMLLGGIALGALAIALIGLLIFASTDQQLRDLTFWTMGSLGGASWIKVATIAPLVTAFLALTLLLSRGLNALALGEASAFYVGMPVQSLKRAAIMLVSLLTGCAVAVSGTIGFIGIVVPHLLRLSIGADHRFLIPASALLGASLLLAADMIARTIVTPAELPIGIVMACIGAPFFLWVLLRKRNVLDL